MSIEGLKYYLHKRGGLFFFLASRGLMNRMTDEAYLKKVFKYSLGYELNLDDPKTYNEKLQWLKLHDRNPLYTQLVDKYEVKKYSAEKIGSEYVVPVLGGPWDSVDEIDFDALPEQFVLKCTHDSGGIVICRDKASFDAEAAKAKLRKRLKRNFYWADREWPYKNVKPRVFAEAYLENAQGELPDYKFFTFNGQVRLLYIATGRNSADGTKCDYYDENFGHLNYVQGHENAPVPPEKPRCFEQMKALASVLGKDFCQVRVDFFEADDRVYFGEFTFFHWGGLAPVDPPEWDETLGSWVTLPERSGS